MNRRILIRAASFFVALCIFAFPALFSFDDGINALTAHAETTPADNNVIVSAIRNGFASLWNFAGSAVSTGASWVVGILAGAFGTIFNSIGIVFLVLAGTIFDASLHYSVVQFGGVFGSVLEGPINLVWSVFRDIGNIVIIFMFIFIAFMTILDNHTYNVRTYAVKIIIIALFINFSLFFAKSTIDVTNYFAYQFYQGIANIAAQGEQPTIAGSQVRLGIAGFYMSAMRVTSYGDMFSTLWENINDGGRQLATVVGLFAFLMLATAIFLYGAILLIIRIVMLILLMTISSLAFAANIIPGYEDKFKEWYKALFQQALFGPILMIMLWAVAHLAQALIGSGSRISLGQAIANPARQDAAVTFMSYFIICGLLFAAIKIASSLAAKSDSAFGPLGKMFAILRGVPAGAAGGAVSGMESWRRKRRAGDNLAEREAADFEMKNAKTIEDYRKAREKRDSANKRIESGASLGWAGAALDKAIKATRGVSNAAGLPVGKAPDASLKKDVKEIEDKRLEAARQLEAEARQMQQANKKKYTAEEVAAMKNQQSQIADAIKQNTDAITGLRQNADAIQAERDQNQGSIGTLEQTLADAKARGAPIPQQEASQLTQLKATVQKQDQDIQSARQQIDRRNADIERLKREQALNRASIEDAEGQFKAAEKAAKEKRVREENTRLVKELVASMPKKDQPDAKAIEVAIDRLGKSLEQIKREENESVRLAAARATAKRAEERESASGAGSHQPAPAAANDNHGAAKPAAGGGTPGH
jgi:hypothetical protein